MFLDESFDFFNLIIFLSFFTEIHHPRTVVTSHNYALVLIVILFYQIVAL